MNGKVVLTCPNCGETKEVPVGLVEQSSIDVRLCSKQCAHEWKVAWTKTLKKLVRRRDEQIRIRG